MSIIRVFFNEWTPSEEMLKCIFKDGWRSIAYPQGLIENGKIYEEITDQFTNVKMVAVIKESAKTYSFVFDGGRCGVIARAFGNTLQQSIKVKCKNARWLSDEKSNYPCVVLIDEEYTVKEIKEYGFFKYVIQKEVL